MVHKARMDLFRVQESKSQRNTSKYPKDVNLELFARNLTFNFGLLPQVDPTQNENDPEV